MKLPKVLSALVSAVSVLADPHLRITKSQGVQSLKECNMNITGCTGDTCSGLGGSGVWQAIPEYHSSIYMCVDKNKLYALCWGPEYDEANVGAIGWYHSCPKQL